MKSDEVAFSMRLDGLVMVGRISVVGGRAWIVLSEALNIFQRGESDESGSLSVSFGLDSNAIVLLGRKHHCFHRITDLDDSFSVFFYAYARSLVF